MTTSFSFISRERRKRMFPTDSLVVQLLEWDAGPGAYHTTLRVRTRQGGAGCSSLTMRDLIRNFPLTQNILFAHGQ